MAHPTRPLSPHLQVYRPQITSVLSITHRMTGIFLTLGAAALVLWLAALAGGEETFDKASAVLRTVWGKALLAAWSLAFYYHLCNGIRHLFWDMGKGFELKNVTRSGIAVLMAAVTLTAATWWCALHYA